MDEDDDWENEAVPTIGNDDDLAPAGNIDEEAERRKREERERILESDRELAEDLFGVSKTQKDEEPESLDTVFSRITLSNREDHADFAKKCVDILKYSTAFQKSAFLKEIFIAFKNELGSETVKYFYLEIEKIAETQGIKLEKPVKKPDAKSQKKKGKPTLSQRDDTYDVYDDEDYGEYDDYN